jgi:hypothetical protein
MSPNLVPTTDSPRTHDNESAGENSWDERRLPRLDRRYLRSTIAPPHPEGTVITPLATRSRTPPTPDLPERVAHPVRAPLAVNTVGVQLAMDGGFLLTRVLPGFERALLDSGLDPRLDSPAGEHRRGT